MNLKEFSFLSETSFDEADTSESSQTESKQTETSQDSSEQVSPNTKKMYLDDYIRSDYDK